jgi:hypothetical protein
MSSGWPGFFFLNHPSRIPPHSIHTAGDLRNLAPRLGSMLRDCKVPRDGIRRYIYDIWQPLALLVVTVSFTTFFITKFDPYASMQSGYDWFFCNADGTLVVVNDTYRPFWDPQLYFSVNIPFGRLPFSRAKVIDAAWDAVVGRGGQFVAAVLAYRTLRRSLTLTMETCSVPIPAVASLYCGQIQLIPVGRIIHTMFWHWGPVHLIWQQPILRGRARFGVQLFACTYVLLFATLASVMTGYRAQLTGYSSSGANKTDQLFPVSKLVEPRFVLLDGVRVGLPNKMYAYDSIVYPTGMLDYYDSEYTFTTSYFNISEFLDISREFQHPYGVLLDC